MRLNCTNIYSKPGAKWMLKVKYITALKALCFVQSDQTEGNKAGSP